MVTVYGASDDLIEIEGDIREEFYADSELPSWLAFSDGTVLRIQYMDDGIWRINRDRSGAAAYSKVEAGSADDDNYSDRVTLAGKIEWVVRGTDCAPRREK